MVANHYANEKGHSRDVRDSVCSRDSVPSSGPMHAPARIESAPARHRPCGTASHRFSASHAAQYAPSLGGGCFMEIDEEKVDEAVLALLYLTTFKDKPRWRAWKGQSWDVLDRLHQKGYISDPATKAKSVLLSEEGAQRSRDLFEKYFAK